MAEHLQLPTSTSREEIYQAILPQIDSLIRDESDLIANLANVAAVLSTACRFHWVGFYRMIDGELVLGPFQGPLACTRIALHQGVCGAAARAKQTVVVPDVDAFPGHIACSSKSRSEIVVPLVTRSGEVQLVLDVDSDKRADFSDVDVRYLEELISLLAERHFAPD